MVEILILGASLFLIGGFLVLERRCLGQMAFVQPLALCALAGIAIGNPASGIWLGASLQLMSAKPIQRIDWALVGVVSAASLVVAHVHGVDLLPGSPLSVLCVANAFATGLLGFLIEKQYARIDGDRLRHQPFWKSESPACEIESIVHRTLGRWMVLGGLLVLFSTVLFTSEVLLFQFLAPQQAHATGTFATIAVPAVGVVVLLSSLRRYAIIGWAGASAAVLLGVSLI